MAAQDWQNILGWTEEQSHEMRCTGFSLLKEGMYPKALLFFQALTLLHPENPYDAQVLGALHLQIGENVEAVEALDKALLLAPHHAPTLLNKVKALLQLERTTEALDIARRLIANPDKSVADNASVLITMYS